MCNLYCRLSRMWVLGLIPADQVKCDKEAWECLDCPNYLGPGSLEDNAFDDEVEGVVLRPM